MLVQVVRLRRAVPNTELAVHAGHAPRIDTKLSVPCRTVSPFWLSAVFPPTPIY